VTRDIRRRLKRKGLDARQIKIYAHLHSHCFNGPACWPSQKLIGKRCGMSRQLVNAVCQELRDHGVITWEHRHVRGSRNPCNVYTLRYWTRPKIMGTVRVLKRLERCSRALPDTKGQSRRALAPERDERHRDQGCGKGHSFLGADVHGKANDGQATTAVDAGARAQEIQVRRSSRMDQRRRPQHITVVPDLTCARCQELARELEAKTEIVHELSVHNTTLAERVSGHAVALEVAGQKIRNLETSIARQARKAARSEQVEKVIEHWRKHRPKTKASSFPPGGKNWQTIEKALSLMAEDEDGPVRACCEAIDGLHIAPWERYGKRAREWEDEKSTLRNRLEHALGDETKIEKCRAILRWVRGDEADRVFALWQVARASEGVLFSVLLEKIGGRGQSADRTFDVEGIPTTEDGR
jgi:hypothetical protein